MWKHVRLIVILGIASCGGDERSGHSDAVGTDSDLATTSDGTAGDAATTSDGTASDAASDATTSDITTPDVDTFVPPPHCMIDAGTQDPGELDPTNPCAVCDPTRSTSAWSPTPDATVCGASQRCYDGACETVCEVFDIALRDGDIDPFDPCQVCAIATATDALVARPDGSACASGAVCAAGLCHDGCLIEGVTYATGAVSATDPCMSCWPTSSPTAWSANGTCAVGEVPPACADTQADAANCGVCGNVCASASCAAGRCALMPLDLTSDGVNVYWANYGSNTVVRRRVGGGSVVTLATGQSRPWAVAVGAPWVYWTNYEGGTVMRTRTDGSGAPEPIADHRLGPQSMLATATHIYWADYAIQTAGSVTRVRLDGSQPESVDDGSCPIDAGKICFGDVTSLAASADHLYWASHGGSRSFFRASLADLHLIDRLFGTLGWDQPIAVAVDATYFYFALVGPGTIMRAPLAGGDAEPIASGIANVNDIAVDDTHVYWADFDTTAGGIGRALKDGTGSPEVFAASPLARYLIVDATSVMWTTFAPDGGVTRQAK